jgi:hypothetical protein
LPSRAYLRRVAWGSKKLWILGRKRTAERSPRINATITPPTPTALPTPENLRNVGRVGLQSGKEKQDHRGEDRHAVELNAHREGVPRLQREQSLMESRKVDSP